MVQQADEGGQNLFHSLKGWGRILVATQVRQSPGDVPQVARLKMGKGDDNVSSALLEFYYHLVVGSHHYSCNDTVPEVTQQIRASTALLKLYSLSQCTSPSTIFFF